MPIYNMSNNFKKLSYHFSYLKIEREEITLACESVEEEIKQYMEELSPGSVDSISESESTPSEESNKDKKINNKDLKKLYRRIVERTHPDKTGNDNYSKMFSDSTKAYKSGNIGILLEIASSLNIEVLELSDETIVLLNENISDIYDEIKEKKTSAAWHWVNSISEEEKTEIAKNILKFKGIII